MITASIIRFVGRLFLITAGLLIILSLAAFIYFERLPFWFSPRSFTSLLTPARFGFAIGNFYLFAAIAIFGLGLSGWVVCLSLTRLITKLKHSR